MLKKNDPKSSGRVEKQRGSHKGLPTGQQQPLYDRGKPTISSSSLHGMPVTNQEGDDLGVLSELMIEMQRGTVAYAILKFGDDKSFAIPYNMLQINSETMTIQANIQREVFEHGRGMRPMNNGDTDRQN